MVIHAHFCADLFSLHIPNAEAIAFTTHSAQPHIPPPSTPPTTNQHSHYMIRRLCVCVAWLEMLTKKTTNIRALTIVSLPARHQIPKQMYIEKYASQPTHKIQVEFTACIHTQYRHKNVDGFQLLVLRLSISLSLLAVCIVQHCFIQQQRALY